MDRLQLKAQLLLKRHQFFPRKGHLPVCGLCGGPIFAGDPCHLHETLVTRGNAQGLPKEQADLIYDERNCHLLHAHPCHVQAPGRRTELVRKLVVWYGIPQMRAFVESLGLKSPDEFLNQINS